MLSRHPGAIPAPQRSCHHDSGESWTSGPETCRAASQRHRSWSTL